MVDIEFYIFRYGWPRGHPFLFVNITMIFDKQPLFFDKHLRN